MKYRPTPGRLLVEEIKNERLTTGGLMIPDTVALTMKHGKVVASCGRLTDSGICQTVVAKVGEAVMFPAHVAVEIRDGDQTFLLLEETSVAVTYDLPN